jgi:phosphohistidine phosphatase
MMRLYLVRHGIAMDRAEPKCPPDAERPLTPRGRRRTRAAAEGLRALGVDPDALLSSPLVRAVQTAEIFADVLRFPVPKIQQTEALKVASPPAELMRELAKLRSRQVLCFGHEPHLHQIIAYVLRAQSQVTELKRAGIACLELKTFAPATGTLVELYPARTLRMLSKSPR